MVLNTVDGRAARLLVKTYTRSPARIEIVRKDVKWIVRQLVAKGIPIDTKTFSAAMHVMGSGKQAGVAAVELYAMMRDLDIKPDAVCFDTLLAKCSADELSYITVREDKRASGSPLSKIEVHSFLKMLHYKLKYTGCSVYADAKQCVEEAKEAGIVLDPMHYAAIIQTCDTIEQLDTWLTAAKARYTISADVVLSCMEVACRLLDVANTLLYFKMVVDLVGERQSIVHVKELCKVYRITGQHRLAEATWRTYSDLPFTRHAVIERLANLAALQTEEKKCHYQTATRVFSDNAKLLETFDVMLEVLMTSPRTELRLERAALLEKMRHDEGMGQSDRWDELMAVCAACKEVTQPDVDVLCKHVPREPSSSAPRPADTSGWTFSSSWPAAHHKAHNSTPGTPSQLNESAPGLLRDELSAYLEKHLQL